MLAFDMIYIIYIILYPLYPIRIFSASEVTLPTHKWAILSLLRNTNYSADVDKLSKYYIYYTEWIRMPVGISMSRF